MLSEYIDIENITLLLPYAGIVLGILFGITAQWSKFCFRSAVIEPHSNSRYPMTGAYLLAILIAGITTQLLVSTGLLSLEGTRFAQSDIALGPILIGGALFGSGMILTRGCPSRLTALAAQGNLRALFVLLVFAIIAYASLRGILAAPRNELAQLTTINAMPVLPQWAAILISLAALVFIWKSKITPRLIVASTSIGLIIALGWFTTGALLSDPFDPLPADSIAFTSGASDALFFTMVSSAISPSFPSGVFVGVLLGAFLAALFRKELRVEGFEDNRQTLRYLLGAAMMGVGGVWAGGCTIGAGLTGTSTLSIGAILALMAMTMGAVVTNAFLSSRKAVENTAIRNNQTQSNNAKPDPSLKPQTFAKENHA